MPIVLSYEDVDALGSLAMNAGEVTGRAAAGRQDAALLQQINAQRDAEATRRMQIEASERQAQQDREFRAQQSQADRQFRYDQLATQADFNQSRLMASQAEALARGQADLQGQMLEHGLRTARDKQLHEQTMERINREAQLGKYSRATNGKQPMVSAGGLPNQQQLDQEMQQFGHLIPMEPGVSAESAARKRENALQTAQQIGGMATEQIEQLITTRPDSEWNPFFRAVVEARKQVSGERGAGQYSMMAEGGMLPRQGVPPQPLQSGAIPSQNQGYTTPLSGLSDQQLMGAAQNPELLRQLIQQQQRPQ